VSVRYRRGCYFACAVCAPVDRVYGRRIFVSKSSFRGSDDASRLLKTPRYVPPEIVGKDYLAVFSLPLIFVAVIDAIEELCPASLRHCSRQVFGLYTYYFMLLYFVLYNFWYSHREIKCIYL